MPVKKINEFTDGSSTLSSDDLLVLMDAPDSSGQQTKYISVGDFSTLLNNDLENYGTVNNICSKILSGDNNTIDGCYSIIGGGRYNTTSGNYNSILGGISNTTSSNNSTILGGQQNTASGYYSVIAGGKNNISSSYTSAVLGGYSNTASSYGSNVNGGENNNTTSYAYYSAINGGINNTISGQYSNIAGGKNNTVSSNYGAVLGGKNVNVQRYGQISHSSGGFGSISGTAQHNILTLRGITNSDETIQLSLDQNSEYIIVNNGYVLSGTINIVGINANGSKTARYIRQFTIKNVANTTTLVGSVNSIGTDESSGTILSISANNTSKTLDIVVTGVLSEIWRWVAVVDCVESKYGT